MTEPKGCPVASCAEVIAALAEMFNRLEFGSNGVGGAPVADDPDADSLLIDQGAR